MYQDLKKKKKISINKIEYYKIENLMRLQTERIYPKKKKKKKSISLIPIDPAAYKTTPIRVGVCLGEKFTSRVESLLTR